MVDQYGGLGLVPCGYNLRR